MLFAKNSDRPVTEPQVVEAPGRRRRGGALRTQYLEVPDEGAAAAVLSRPTWLWGAEHGVNEHGVAIGNELVNTVDDPGAADPALLGMDLVRLGLERASGAEEALEVVTGLLERYGQGGVGDEVHGLAYWSSFLIADRTSAWVLETSGRTWAARPSHHGAAISNRLSLRADWTRASPDVGPGADFDAWRDPATPTGFADHRLAASLAVVDRAHGGAHPVAGTVGGPGDPRSLVAHLRDHGTGPWGAPGALRAVVPPPAEVLPDGTGVTLCMHVRAFEATTASMVAELSAEDAGPGRAWVALGSPCSSVYVPVLLPSYADDTWAVVPGALADEALWRRFASLRDAVESEAGALGQVRAVLDPIEEALWEEADTLGADEWRWWAFAGEAVALVTTGLDRLARAGLGRPGDGTSGDRR